MPFNSKKDICWYPKFPVEDPITVFYENDFEGFWDLRTTHKYWTAMASDRLFRLRDAHEELTQYAGDEIYPRGAWQVEVEEWKQKMDACKEVTVDNYQSLTRLFEEIEERVAMVEGEDSQFWYDLDPEKKLESIKKLEEIYKKILAVISARKLLAWLLTFVNYDIPAHRPLPRYYKEKRVPKDKKVEEQIKKLLKCGHHLCMIRASVIRSVKAGRKRIEERNIKKWTAREQRAKAHKKRMEEAQIRRDERRREQEVKKAQEEELRAGNEAQEKEQQKIAQKEVCKNNFLHPQDIEKKNDIQVLENSFEKKN